MRNLGKGQHIFIAFQNGKAVLDSQLRPRMDTSLENADKWTPTINKGKIEYVEYAPTFTPPNEWVSVEERLPPLRKNVLVCAYWHEHWGVYMGWNSGHGWTVSCGIGQRSDVQVSHWMLLPAPPNRRPPEGEV